MYNAFGIFLWGGLSFYVEKIIEDNLPSVEETLADLKRAWEQSLEAE